MNIIIPMIMPMPIYAGGYGGGNVSNQFLGGLLLSIFAYMCWVSFCFWLVEQFFDVFEGWYITLIMFLTLGIPLLLSGIFLLAH